MPSFDIISEIDLQEVDNAVNQARKEVASRYDFRGSKSEIQWDKILLTILADDEYKLGALKDILQSKLHRRGIDIRALKYETPEQATGMSLRQKITLVQGIDKELAKDITKIIRDSKLKVQAQIQDEKIRVTSKSRDELQECMTVVKSSEIKIPLQFSNLRE